MNFQLNNSALIILQPLRGIEEIPATPASYYYNAMNNFTHLSRPGLT
tara:strand:+ start:636 stop:776 length:141 start_codon:yes stop_codon:yes gene_type:complete